MKQSQLRKYRLQYIGTPSDFARIMGVSKQTIWLWENSLARMSFEHRAKFAGLYGVTIEYLNKVPPRKSYYIKKGDRKPC